MGRQKSTTQALLPADLSALLEEEVSFSWIKGSFLLLRVTDGNLSWDSLLVSQRSTAELGMPGFPY